VYVQKTGSLGASTQSVHPKTFKLIISIEIKWSNTIPKFLIYSFKKIFDLNEDKINLRNLKIEWNFSYPLKSNQKQIN